MKQHPALRFTKRFLANEEGNVLMLFGLSILFLVGIGGSAVDLGAQQLMRTKLQGSADAAATSAASLTTPNGNVSNTDRTNAANRYFNLNFPATYMNIARPTPNVNLTSQDITVAAVSQVPTKFVTNFGIPNLPADGVSRVSLAAQSVSDYDVVVVMDESGSTQRCASNGSWACQVPGGSYTVNNNSILAAMRNGIRTMADNIVPVGNNNPNVRMGVVGFSGQITNKWGPSSNNADVVQGLNSLRHVYQNFDNVGLLAGAQMIAGGSAGVPNARIGGGAGDGTVAENITTPRPRTNRTLPSDANGMSPVKYVILVSDGGIMVEPSATHYRPNASFPDMYNSAVASACPGRNYYTEPDQSVDCYPAFQTACNAVKNTGGNDAVHLIVINFFQNANAAQRAQLIQCASGTLPGGPSYSNSVKPDATKDFYNAPDVASLNTILQNVTTEIRKVRIIQ